MYLNSIFIILSLFLNLRGEELFLTEFEYSQMLYNYPRGVSCSVCHGKNGDEVFSIDYYGHYGKSGRVKKHRKLEVKPIYLLGFNEFKRALNSKRNRFMPEYRLSREEIKSIYYFIQKSNGRIKSGDYLEENLTFPLN
jgi:hypothetical protein